MIAKLTGKIISKSTSFLVIDVSGVGYKCFASNTTLSELKEGSVSSVLTHLVVRENVLDLYCFKESDEKDFFELLIAISGIGPKSALAILSLAPVSTLRKAVSSGDASYLTRVSGIGRKNAEKIILELKDKAGLSNEKDGLGLKEEAEALEALRALGYSLNDSRDALKRIQNEITGTNERIREALKILGNG